MLVEGLRLAGMREEELEKLPGSDPRKAALAALVGSKTTVDMGWIADRLRMGSRQYATQLLYQERRARGR